MPSLDPPFGAIPETPEDLTPTWLATVLTRHGFSAAIDSIEFRSPPTSSLTAEVLRVIPRFHDETTGVTPPLLWKRSAQDAARRAAFQADYATEVAFYRDIAPDLDISIPRCLAAAYEEKSGAHLLLLEDRSPPTAVDFVRGISADETRTTLRELARLHASSWAKPPPQALPAHPIEDQPSPADESRTSDTAYLSEHTDEHAAQRARQYRSALPHLRSTLADGPQTLIHGDTHPANILLPATGGARPCLVDWQLSGLGAPILDVARYLVLALAIEERRASERELLAYYLEQLQTHRDPYDPARAERDYRTASLLQWGWALDLLRHESIWDQDTRDAMPTLVKRAAAAFDDAASNLDLP